MKPVLFLHYLLLTCLAPQLVPGSPQEYILKYILEPPPCRTEPGNCTQFCTMQEDCPEGLQCCSAFCGIICTLNKYIMQKRPRRRSLRKRMTSN
ncbi:WAP four-disulfide core domain 13 [Rhinolophus ferrumequinum]|uniref:WAP four-disulfide core domain 13 n=1 Tax=Rhinolophus ferrumequinum TaxID=59479 RepID=A0A671FSQ1_RHIFE|nr:WAP four-disulfide core domain 13 [Rhinolophus ferrumequinum]